jgi:DNA-binding transcriptional MerR regulator
MMSRKITIRELAAIVGVAVPTLRKYGECGLLSADAVAGRTNLFDERSAINRIRDINDLKRKGYSLALIREKIDDRALAERNIGLDLGIDGPLFSAGRHILLVVRNLREYYNFARDFVGNGLRAGQAVVLVVHPNRREPLNEMLAHDGFDVAQLIATRQLLFGWYDSLEHFDPAGQVESWQRAVGAIVDAGWQELRALGDPEIEIQEIDAAALREYERLVDAFVENLPAIVVCTWMAPLGSASTLLELQRNHQDVKFGDQVYSRA